MNEKKGKNNDNVPLKKINKKNKNKAVKIDTPLIPDAMLLQNEYFNTIQVTHGEPDNAKIFLEIFFVIHQFPVCRSCWRLCF